MNCAGFNDRVEDFYEKLQGLSEKALKVLPDDGSWSLIEILGHLIDSVSNNHQRIVRLEEGDLDNFPGYNIAHWVKAQDYRSIDPKAVTTLWYSCNRLLLHLVKNVNPKSLQNKWTRRRASNTRMDDKRRLPSYAVAYRQAKS